MSTEEPREPVEEPPVMPTAAEVAAARHWSEPVERPTVVRYAFVVWVLAGIVGVGNAVLMLINKQTFIDHAIEQRRGANISNEQVASGATTLLWMFLVAAVVFGVLFGLFAYKAQERERRARLMLTIMCVISVVFYLVVLQVYLSPVIAALVLAGTVLLYLPKANKFFEPGALPT
jgi:ABC-type multidrug transport system permease subunit